MKMGTKGFFELAVRVKLDQNYGISHLDIFKCLKDLFSLMLLIVNPQKQIASIDLLILAYFLHFYLKDFRFFGFAKNFKGCIG